MAGAVFWATIAGVGLVTGLLDAVTGTGGLLSIPALIFAGLPPQAAVAADRFGTVGSMISQLIIFHRANKVRWNDVPMLSALALAGSLAGANILLATDTHVLQRVLGMLIIVLLPVALLKARVRTRRPTTVRRAVGFVLYGLVMTYGGFLGQGTGPLIFWVLTNFLGFTMVEVLATGTIPWFVLAASSTALFAANRVINYPVALVFLAGMVVGGWAGARFAVGRSETWLQRAVVVLVVISGVKLLAGR